MPIAPILPHVKAADVPLDRLAANPNVSKEEKVQEACRQFEAVLLRQILTEARKSVLAKDEGDSPTVTGIYNDVINNQMADSISHSGTFGLAKSLEKQVAHQVLPKALAPAQPADGLKTATALTVKKT